MALVSRKEICAKYKLTLYKLVSILFHYKQIGFPEPVKKQGNYLLYCEKQIAEWFSKNDAHRLGRVHSRKKPIEIDCTMMMAFLSGKLDPMHKQRQYRAKLQSVSGLPRNTTKLRIGVPIF